MRKAFVVAAALIAAAPAFADPQPYEALAATYDRGIEEDAALRAALEALRSAVAARDLARIDAMLAPDYQTVECRLDPTRPCAPRVRKPAAAQAYARLAPGRRIRDDLCCRDVAPGKITAKMRDDEMLSLIGAALAEETVGASPLLPGEACLPAPAAYDREKAAALAGRADVEPENLRVLAEDTDFRDKPEAGAPVLARLPRGQIAPLVTEAERPPPDGWSAVVLPSGAVGYTDAGGLNDLAAPGLCLRRDGAGVWRIVAMVERLP